MDSTILPKFYTNVSLIRNSIIHRYVDKAGNRHTEKLKPPFELFIQTESENPDSVSIYGDKLKRKEFETARDMKEFVKEYSDMMPIYGMTSAYHQFIADTYKHDVPFDFDKIVIANIDIETEIGNGFPNPTEAKQAVNSISLNIIGKDSVIVFTTLDYDKAKDTQANDSHIVVKCNNERELFVKFLNSYDSLKVDALSGWNCSLFDLPYLINRGLQIVPESIKLISPVHEYTPHPFREKTEGDNSLYVIEGVDVLDYLELYKKFNYDPLPNFRLETVAQHELGKGKQDYCGYDTLKEFYLGNPSMFVRYNIQDVLLVNEMEKKLGFLYLAYTLAYTAKINPSEIFGQVKFWDVFVYNTLKAKGIQIPPKVHHEKSSFDGAFVRDVIVGKSYDVVSFDLTSLN